MAVKKNLYTVLLLAIIAFKVSSATIHIHLHHDCHHDEEHAEDCTLCDYAIYNQTIEFSTPAYFELPSQTKIAVKAFLAGDLESQAVRNPFVQYSFTRPPPTL